MKVKSYAPDRCEKCEGWERKRLDWGTCLYSQAEPLTYGHAECRAVSRHYRNKLFTPKGES